MQILQPPKSNLIEKTALEFACTFYEAARSSGLTSKYKDAREYGRANFEKFIPKAVEILMDMLGKKHISTVMKDEIHFALLERVNNPELELEIFGPKLPPTKEELLNSVSAPPIRIN